MDKELLAMVGFGALVFLFILPPWSETEPELSVTASQANGTVSFTATYATPWEKSSYLVVYGPFVHDAPGHEEGNNIYVLTAKTGVTSDTLTLQPGEALDSLRVELWNDHEKLRESEVPI